MVHSSSELYFYCSSTPSRAFLTQKMVKGFQRLVISKANFSLLLSDLILSIDLLILLSSIYSTHTLMVHFFLFVDFCCDIIILTVNCNVIVKPFIFIFNVQPLMRIAWRKVVDFTVSLFLWKSR